jgi:hypothetical protein
VVMLVRGSRSSHFFVLWVRDVCFVAGLLLTNLGILNLEK